MSNNLRSKQFLKILRDENFNHESMFQRMFRMIRQVDQDAFVTAAVSASQLDLINKQVRDKNFDLSIEPCRRDTFPAIALAAAYLHDVKHIDLDAGVIVCPVDPYVELEYFLMLKELDDYIKNFNSKIILMGIEPTYPSAKYGYIIPESKERFSKVLKFKEKPDALTAQEYINQGALWNGGVFAFRLNYILDKAKDLLGACDYENLFNNYAELPKISFDYAVLEREDNNNIAVMRFAGSWKDLGTWNTLTEAMSEYNSGHAVSLHCDNTHIINELDTPLIALGVKNLAIIATQDGILVTEKGISDKLKDALALLRQSYPD